MVKAFGKRSSSFDGDMVARFSMGIMEGELRGMHDRSKLSSLGLNPNPAINYHPGVSQAG